jgi:hypothetical protein
MTYAVAVLLFMEHDTSHSKALRLSTMAFQIRATSLNLSTGNCGQAGTWPSPRGEAFARTACVMAT